MDTPVLHLLSLCSGSGQLDIAVANACRRHGIRTRVVGYAERASEACAVLKSRMEDAALEPAPIWSGDLESFPAASFHGMVDGIVAGFPCQPHSVAGKGAGRDDERNLLPAILKIADTVGAGVLFLENVAGLKAEFDYICALLLQSGWDAQWGCLRAADVGASHRRDRWFCVACRAGGGSGTSGTLNGFRRAGASRNGSEYILANIKHAGTPQYASAQRKVGSEPGPHGEGVLADRQRPGLQGHGRHGEGGSESGRLAPEPAGPVADDSDALANGDGSGSLPVFAPGPADPRWWDILTRYPFLAPALPTGALHAVGEALERRTQVEIEPAVRSLADGLGSLLESARADMLRLAGNGVVPQQAEHAFTQLLARVMI